MTKSIHIINNSDIKRGGAQKILALLSSKESIIIGKDQVCNRRTGISSHIYFFIYILFIILKKKPVAVVFHSRFLLLYTYLIRAMGIKVFFYMHAAYRNKNWAFRFFKCSYYIAVSESAKNTLIAVGVSKKIIKIIQNPLLSSNHPYFSSALTYKDVINIGYIGSLKPWKAPDIACSFFRKFSSKNNITVNFKLIGDGPLRIHLLNYQIKGYRIEAVGYKENPFENLIDYPIIVIPSLEEGFGLIAIEAIFNGKIIIYNQIPALNSILQNDKFSFSFNIRDYASFQISLQKAISLLQSMPEQQALKIRSDNVRKKYSLEKYLEEIKDIL